MKSILSNLLSPVLGACATVILASPAARATDPAALRAEALKVVAPIPDKMPGAEKDTPAMVKLGEKLFFDKRLSKNEQQSCNSCHRVDGGLAGVDNEPTSPGAFGKRGDRNSPTVLNAGFHFAQFWDGRAETLKDQAKGPVLNPGEMAMPSEEEVMKRLNADDTYKKMFNDAFGAEAPMSYDNMAAAIAAFERTLRTDDRFDAFLKGDNNVLTANELKGLEVFLTIGCTTCHNGPLLGGNSYQKVGLVKPYDNDKDKGRVSITKEESDEFKFKVPSLRNVALTYPYFHDGRIATLDKAAKTMTELQLGRELSAEQTEVLVAFLKSLSDKKRTAMK